MRVSCFSNGDVVPLRTAHTRLSRAGKAPTMQSIVIEPKKHGSDKVTRPDFESAERINEAIKLGQFWYSDGRTLHGCSLHRAFDYLTHSHDEKSSAVADRVLPRRSSGVHVSN